MAAQSGKLFQEILCEGRAHPVDSPNPAAAKTIDDLKKQVSRQRNEIEAERTKFRELQRVHERELRLIREQAEKKLDSSLEALSRRKDDEKLTEISQVKERLLKQNKQELRTQRTELEEEMKRLERRLTREREESMRKVLDTERRKTEEELSHYLPEDSVVTREEHLKAEIFRLGEEVERLEFQVINLQRENREQINVIKKAKQEHKLELENIKKKNQSEAARDLAQLKLAEQIIQEKERVIHEEEYRVDIALMEKEALAEELLNLKSHKTLDALSRDEVVMSPTLGKRMSMPGGGGVLQRRVEELEGAVRKLDEERRQLKQENASLRKAAVKEGGGEGDGKTAEEKLKRLRKRNAELAALAGQLNEKIKGLKLENEQLQKLSGSVTSSISSSVAGGERVKGGGGGGGDGEVRRSYSRQHAKDISEYTKQILGKDREIESLRTRLSKYEVDGKARYEPAPEMEKRVRSMAIERLKMERVMVQLYSKVSDPLDVGKVTKQEMENESREMERIFDENKSLRDQLALLKSQARMDEVDTASIPQSPRDQLLKQHSLPAHVAGGGKGGSERERQLVEENSKLQARISILAKHEAEVVRLEAALREVEGSKASYEHQNKRLTQQLKDTQQLAQEMDAVQEMCVKLEKELDDVKGQLSDRESKLSELEKNYQSVTESLTDARQEADILRGKVKELEEEVRGKQVEIRELASELDQQGPSPPLPHGCDVSLQTSFTPSPEKQNSGNTTSVLPHSEVVQFPPSSQPNPLSTPSSATTGDTKVKNRPSSAGEGRVKLAGKARRVKSPVKRTSALGNGSGTADADVSLDNEMRLAGIELTDPYDSSEGMGFSDTNLDGSSLLSMEGTAPQRDAVAEDADGERGRDGGRDGGRCGDGDGDGGRDGGGDGGGDGGRGRDGDGDGGGGMAAKEQSLVSTTSDLHKLGWVGQKEGERPTDAPSEGEIDGSTGPRTTECRESHDESHDFTGESHDIGMKVIDLEALAEADSIEDVAYSSSGSEKDLNTQKDDTSPSQELAPLTSDPTTVSQNTVAVFVAKFNYNPAEMSPNPNYDQELVIGAGDYLYVFGGMDADGFYSSQLVTGEKGLVPSNFVEKVADGEGDLSMPRPNRSGTRTRRMSDLQDIPEQDEDLSTSSSTLNHGIPPPCNLELEKQFVEDGKYSVVIQWSSPPSLAQTSTSPSSTSPQQHQVTYHTYINQQFKEAVEGCSGVMTAHLRGIPRHQLVKISVRTVTEEGESPDPKKLIILNPQYPEAPTRVQVSLVEERPSSHALLVQWTPSRRLQEGAQISGYVIFINGHPLTDLQSTDTSTDSVCARLVASHLESLSLLPEERLVLTVRAVSDQYQSLDSVPIMVPRELFDQVMVSSNWSSTSGEVSMQSCVSSSERTGILQAQGISGPSSSDSNTAVERHVTPASGYITQSNSHVTTNGVQPKVNGSVEHTDGDGSEALEEVDGERRMLREPRYYVATFSYNPAFHSPNENVAEDELTFRDGDIITACSEVDEEGFFEGVLRSKRGLVPSNMVELVTDPDRLEQIPQLLAEQRCRSPDPLSQLPKVNGGDSSSETSRKMRAAYRYNPATDSPNENVEDELCIQEGDIIAVFGRPDEDGFYQGELKGKRGLVPSNFLEELECTEGKVVAKSGMDDMGMEIFAASEQDMEQARRIIAEASDSLKRSSSTDSAKHKKGLFSKGKSLLSKGVGKK